MPKDYISGVSKIRAIMNNSSVFVCRICGLSHDKFNKAERCCKEQARNKSGQYTQNWRNI